MAIYCASTTRSLALRRSCNPSVCHFGQIWVHVDRHATVQGGHGRRVYASGVGALLLRREHDLNTWSREAPVDLPLLCTNDMSREGDGIIRPGACRHEMPWTMMKSYARSLSSGSGYLSQSQKQQKRKLSQMVTKVSRKRMSTGVRPAHYAGPNNINDHGSTTVWALLTT